jgi:hypothetical protein
MAEMQIKIAADVSSAVSGLDKLSKELDQTGKDAVQLGNAVENAGAKIRTLPGVTGQATSTLTNFSRVVQDAPFGLIGIANNIDPLVTSFQQLKASTGTTGGALKALVGQLAGPAGVALAISTVTSLLITFGDRLFSSGQSARQLAEASKKVADEQKAIFEGIARERVEIDKLIIALNSENTTRGQKEAILKKLRAINPQYFGDLKNEEGLINSLNIAYQKYTASLVARSEVAILTRELEDISTEILKLEKAGATTQIIDLGLKRGLDGRIQAARLLTKEERTQLDLNTQLSQQLRERDRLLGQIVQKQTGLELPVPPGGDGGNIKFDFNLIPGIRNLTEFEAKLAGPLPSLLPDLQKAIKNIQTDPKDVTIPVRPRIKAEGTDKAVLEFSTQLTQALQNALQQGLEGIGESLGNLLSGENFGEGILGVISSLLTAIGKALIAYGIAKDTIDKILAPTGAAIPGAAAIGIGIATIAASQLLKNFGGARAEGGPVSGNKTYLVGERGPELFVPNVAGTIVPNDELPSFGQGLASILGGRSGGGTTLRGQDIILAYARTQRSQLRVNG